ncbi:hypothetical protein [Candidatus Minimicrobia naudis]
MTAVGQAGIKTSNVALDCRQLPADKQSPDVCQTKMRATLAHLDINTTTQYRKHHFPSRT